MLNVNIEENDIHVRHLMHLNYENEKYITINIMINEKYLSLMYIESKF